MKRHPRLTNEVKDDLKVAKKIRVPWWALLSLMIVSLPIYWVFDHFQRLEIARPILMGVAALALLIAVKWTLRRRPWFWLTMAAIAALHVPLILLVPWTTRWVPAPVWAGGACLDLVLALVIVEFVGNFAQKPAAVEN